MNHLQVQGRNSEKFPGSVLNSETISEYFKLLHKTSEFQVQRYFGWFLQVAGSEKLVRKMPTILDLFTESATL